MVSYIYVSGTAALWRFDTLLCRFYTLPWRFYTPLCRFYRPIETSTRHVWTLSRLRLSRPSLLGSAVPSYMMSYFPFFNTNAVTLTLMLFFSTSWTLLLPGKFDSDQSEAQYLSEPCLGGIHRVHAGGQARWGFPWNSPTKAT
jgi:hypothetical protein